MATPAKLGAVTAGSTNTFPADSRKAVSKSGNKFDVRVLPENPCQLIFSVYMETRRDQFGGYFDAECALVQQKETGLISKPTVLHLTVPNEAYSYEIMFKIDKARLSAIRFTQPPFKSVEFLVSEFMGPANPTAHFNRCLERGVTYFNGEPADYTNAPEENISFVETDTVSATAGGDRKEPSDQKDNSSKSN